jgi:ribosomal protein S27E
MAIVFNCPYCSTNYRLKNEFGGKTATCKNPICRKVIPIPKPTAAELAAAPADLDSFAAAAFADDLAKADKPTEQMIQVVCTGCDHTWSVEVSKEGKNVRCPECGKVVRVPMRKMEEKADWRSGAGPTLARRETGLDRQGAFGTAAMGGISEGTAREIVKDRDAEEEPEERRKKLIKRGVLLLVVAAAVGVAGYFALKTQKEIKTDANMAQAVKEQKEQGTKDPRFEAIIHRASAEYKCRTAASTEEAAEALKEIQKARNSAKASPGAKGPPTDNSAILAELAVTIPQLLGTTEQVDKGVRFKKDVVVKELRQTIQEISDPDLKAEFIRAATRECAKKGQPTVAEEVAHQLGVGESNELIAQIGLELLRLNRAQFAGDAEGLLKKLGNADTPGTQALRAALGKPGPVKKEGDTPPQPSQAASAEADAIKGDIAKAKAAKTISRRDERAKTLAAVGQTFLESNPGEAVPLLVDAAKILKDSQGTISPWVSIRVCRLLGRAGQAEEAESLSASLPDDQTKSWGRLEALRGRLESLKSQKGDDTWLDPIGDPTKLAAAAKAREVMARHNAAAGLGGEYQGVVKKWPIGSVRPFGVAGIVLGQLDRDGK